MTVLTNRDETLPLDRHRTVALIGRHAVETIDMGGGSAQVNPPYQVSVAEGLTALLGDNVTVVDGVEVRGRPLPADGELRSRPRDRRAGHPRPAVRRRRLPARGAAPIHGGRDHRVRGRLPSLSRGRVRARVRRTGQLEVGVIGVGDWVLRNGEQTVEFRLRSSGTGIGEEMLAPPAETITLERGRRPTSSS